MSTCPKCGGSGTEVEYVQVHHPDGGMDLVPTYKTCSTCNGSGRVS